METQRSPIRVLADWWDQRQLNRRSRQREHVGGRASRWLPTPGSIVFTLLMIGLLLWAQTAGALPLPGYLNAPSAPSTGTIAYQGRLADANGNPLTNTVPMEFRLYNAPTGGTPLWEEFWTGTNSVQVSDGLFNVMLGSLTPIPSSLVGSNTSLFLGITAGTDDEMAPRVQLGSVPFAVQALTVPDGSVTPPKLDRPYVVRTGDTMSGPLLAEGGITTGSESSGKHLTINDVPRAKWKLGTGGYDLTFYSDYASAGTFDPKVVFTEAGDLVLPNGAVRAGNVPLTQMTVVRQLSGGANTEWITVDISNLGLSRVPLGIAQVVDGVATDRVLVHYTVDGSTATQARFEFFRPDGGSIPGGLIRFNLILW